MKSKFLLILTLILLCSGCKVEYTLEIHDDLSISESVLATEDAAFYEAYPYASVRTVIGYILTPNLEYLNENHFVVEELIQSDEAGVMIKNKYQNLEEYHNISKMPFQYNYVDGLKYQVNGDEVTLSIMGNFQKAEQDQLAGYNIDEATVNLVVPFDVISHNADRYNEDTHTYSWDFDEENSSKEMMITFDTTKKAAENKEDFPYVIVGIVVVALLIVGIIVVNMIQKNRLRNSIDE